MRRVNYTIGYINQHATLRFSITVKTQNSEFCILSNPQGDSLTVRNLYPSLSLIVSDEVRDGNRWNNNFANMVSWSRFTGPRYVSRARKFLDEFVSINELFQYRSGELILNMELAKKISFTETTEFERRVMTIPVIGKDLSMNQKYEGVGLFLGNMSTYVIFTYDEYCTLVDYMDNFHYDEMALQLLNLAIVAKEASGLNTDGVTSEPPPSTECNWVEKPKIMPEFK